MGDGERVPLRQILEQWRVAARELADMPSDAKASQAIRDRLRDLRREYVAAFGALRPTPAEPSPFADELAAISDDFLATAAELETLVRHRDAVSDADAPAFDRAIDRVAAEVLRLSQLQREAGDRIPHQPGTSLEDAEPRSTRES